MGWLGRVSVGWRGRGGWARAAMDGAAVGAEAGGGTEAAGAVGGAGVDIVEGRCHWGAGWGVAWPMESRERRLGPQELTQSESQISET